MKSYTYISLLLIPLWLSADSTIPDDDDNRLWESPIEQNITEIQNEDKKHSLNKYILTELSKKNYSYVNIKNNIPLGRKNKAGFEGRSTSYRDDYSRYSMRNFNKPDMLKAYLSSVPAVSEIDDNAIHELKNIDFILSGGTWKPYSLAIAKNHLAFSKARRTNYKFILFSQNSKDDDSIGLMKWLKYKQPYWGKIFLIKKWLKENRVKPGKWIAWIDDDIAINDFKKDKSYLDKIIDSIDPQTCIITAQDYWFYKDSDLLDGGHLPNTGIIMVKNTSYCSDIVQYWLDYADDPTLGKATQKYTLHEQEALAKLKRQFGLGSPAIKFVRNRTISWDFNTFKRFNHFYNDSQMNYNSDTQNDRAIAALINDAYIHHTGMASLYRLALIAHTLFEISGNYPLIQHADDGS